MRHAYGEMGAVRSARTLLKMNQKGGFDCPGCAWPDPDDHRAPTEFCENGAKAVAEEATTKRVTPEFFREHSIHELAQQSDMWLGKQGRITQPMILRESSTHYEPLAWDEAFALIGEGTNALSSPDEALFYTSGAHFERSCVYVSAFRAPLRHQQLARLLEYVSRIERFRAHRKHWCWQRHGNAGRFRESRRDFCDRTESGHQSPAYADLLYRKQRATAVASSALIRCPKPAPNAFKHPQESRGIIGQGTPLSTMWLPVRINGDVALLKGIMKEMLEAEDRAPGHFDTDFIREHTVGFRRVPCRLTR
jgi:anaerobic selenocysteine-containing dehydrogenase